MDKLFSCINFLIYQIQKHLYLVSQLFSVSVVADFRKNYKCIRSENMKFVSQQMQENIIKEFPTT